MSEGGDSPEGENSTASFYRNRITQESRELFKTTPEEVEKTRQNLGKVDIDPKKFEMAARARQTRLKNEQMRLINEHRNKLAQQRANSEKVSQLPSSSTETVDGKDEAA